MAAFEFKPSDVEAHIKTGKLARLFNALKLKYREELNPEGRAKMDIARLLSAAFTKFGDHFENVKAGSLKKLMRLQEQAFAFYQGALKSKELPNVKQLQDILRAMDKEFRNIAKDAQAVAERVEPGHAHRRVAQDLGLAAEAGGRERPRAARRAHDSRPAAARTPRNAARRRDAVGPCGWPRRRATGCRGTGARIPRASRS